MLKIKLTVYFDKPFWIGVYERVISEKIEVARVVFGSEPKDYEIYENLLKNWSNLKFSIPIASESDFDKKINPKRMQRSINKQLSQNGISTKAQEALKQQHEQNVLKRKTFNKAKEEEEKQRKFELKQQKKKQKHKGR